MICQMRSNRVYSTRRSSADSISLGSEPTRHKKRKTDDLSAGTPQISNDFDFQQELTLNPKVLAHKVALFASLHLAPSLTLSHFLLFLHRSSYTDYQLLPVAQN